jgi:glycosyltransferase involved in cell wall biosynthesis
MKCRLFYLIGELHTGGAERQLCYLLREIDRDRYNPAVAVWNFNKTGVHVARIRDLGVPILSFPTNFTSARKLFAFREFVRRLKPSVVHSYSFYTNFAAQWAVMGTVAIPIGSIRSDFIWAIQQCGPVVGRLSAKWPVFQICNSFSAAQTVRSTKGCFAPLQVAVVHNGVDLSLFDRAAAVSTNLIRILGVGYLLPVKRWDRLLFAARALMQKGYSFVLQIAGNGPLEAALKQQAFDLGISERVQFLGHVNNIHDVLEGASFVVHTADSEGCPNSVMEAMACGRALVATDAGDLPILIEHGKTGFLVPRGSQDKLVEYMEKLLLDPQLCQSMGRFARAEAEKRFGLDRLVADTFKAYRSAGWTDA